MGGIKELVADVDVVSEDIQASAVTTAKINNLAVTNAKLAAAVGKWTSTTFTAGGTTAYYTWTCTSACTVLNVILEITTATTADATVTVQDTAGTSAIVPASSSTAACTIRTDVQTAFAQTPPVIDLSAGEALEVTGSIASDETVGKIFVEYIATPS